MVQVTRVVHDMLEEGGINYCRVESSLSYVPLGWYCVVYECYHAPTGTITNGHVIVERMEHALRLLCRWNCTDYKYAPMSVTVITAGWSGLVP